ncbi:hypothetical protein I317_00091 [Kwoniella heveanensis CBS 569]|nr:hypothetical protein I317_00091 [Kwoniella heveanensis CBS 569]
MPPVKTVRNILMELRKICQHPYLSEPELEPLEATEDEQHKQLVESSGKLSFLKLLLPKLKERGHRVLLFSQFKIALDRNFLYGEGIKFLQLDGDIQQAQRQKSMDLFNAPNSDYDVFLLTTRAGGVGINLATADTVILYDPDFNPHQDLQAIARSHRYGQKKKVLVFKLMVKGSVEENIINKGKKKMVLDHLVVQQMGKANEEGDIDDLLLRGAEAVFSNEGGMNVPDIVYNSKNVDELIDKVEADAEAEAQEMERRETAIANGEAEPSRSKRATQFGFAKIWEADQTELLAAEEALDSGDADRLEVNWEQIFENMRKEKAMQDGRAGDGIRIRRMRKAAKGQYVLDIGDQRESTPDGKQKKKRGRPKGKGKDVQLDRLGSASSSDADFTFKPEDAVSADDDAVSVSSVPDGLSAIMTDDHGLPIPRGRGLVGKQKMTKHEKRLWEAARALHGVPNATVPLPLPGPSNGPGTIVEAQAQSQLRPQPQMGTSSIQQNGKRPSDPENEEERKRRRQEARALVISKSDPAARANAASSLVISPFTYEHISPPITDQQFAEAQKILAWLYSIVKELGVDKDMKRWGLMALPEVPPEDRERRYRQLADDTDNRLAMLSQPRYFSLPAQIDKVIPLFRAGAPAIPEKPFKPLPYPRDIGSFLRNPAKAPQQPPPHKHGTVKPYTHTPRRDPGLDFFNSLFGGAPPICENCRGAHQLSECANLPTLVDLASLRQALLSGPDNPADRAASLRQIDRMYALLIKSGRIAAPVQPTSGDHYVYHPHPQPLPRSPAPHTNHIHGAYPPRSSGSNPYQSTSGFANGNLNGGNRSQPISIPSSPAPYHAPPHDARSRARADLNAPLASFGSQSQQTPQHTVPPSVPAPPPRAAAAASTSASASASAQSFQRIINGASICPFCEQRCGKSIRSCATWSTPDGRKAIKNKIKNLQAMIDAGGDAQAIKAFQMPLYDEYKAVSWGGWSGLLRE